MFQRAIDGFSLSLFALLLLINSSEATCYIAAYGLVGKQDGWVSCPGTSSSPSGVETCCQSGSECGQDSLCHVPASANPGSNSWYLAGCTDPNYGDAACRNDCVDYTTTYVEYDHNTHLWACCGNGGCNGTITDDTFSAASPQEWSVITGEATSSTLVPAPATTSTDPTTASLVIVTASLVVASTAFSTEPIETSTASSAQEVSSTTLDSTESRIVHATSLDFKPSPLASPSFGSSRKSTTSNAPAAATSDHKSNGGLSTGAKAGIGSAIVVAVLALIAAVIAIVLLRRNKREKKRHSAPYQMDMRSKVDDPPSLPSTEVNGRSSISELPADSAVHELPSGWTEAKLARERQLV